jgi:hypothetical protein
MMNYISRFFWLAGQAYEFSLLTHPVALLLLLHVCLASIFNFPFKPTIFRKRYLLVFAPFLCSLGMLSLGAVFASDAIPGTAPTRMAGLVWLLFLLHPLASIFIMQKMQGFRWFASSVLLLEGWVAVMCGFISAMSITNDWF